MSSLTAFASNLLAHRATMQAQPNEFDCKRVERALEKRMRYRYVRPEVQPAESGYVVRSPCCSHNIFADGEIIDIAYLRYSRLIGTWTLHFRDHGNRTWMEHSEHPNLVAALAPMLQDSARLFWP
jgi:hypothetical protein